MSHEDAQWGENVTTALRNATKFMGEPHMWVRYEDIEVLNLHHGVDIHYHMRRERGGHLYCNASTNDAARYWDFKDNDHPWVLAAREGNTVIGLDIRAEVRKLKDEWYDADPDGDTAATELTKAWRGTPAVLRGAMIAAMRYEESELFKLSKALTTHVPRHLRAIGERMKLMSKLYKRKPAYDTARFNDRWDMLWNSLAQDHRMIGAEYTLFVDKPKTPWQWRLFMWDVEKLHATSKMVLKAMQKASATLLREENRAM